MSNTNASIQAGSLRILISTDNHLGYGEKDPIRGDDSFRTFHEILRLADIENVDFVLLGGDLFHDNKPSRRTMYQTMSILRSVCMGDKPVRFQIVSDQSINFPNFGIVNYEDPNYNINLPIFSIHGNHDDPSRDGGLGNSAKPTAHHSLAALDILSAANYINYFGKSEKVDAIEIFPILIQKGLHHETKVAIYGLGNMRDERLNRMFQQNKVIFRRPTENPDAWFNIFVTHQNRDNRGRGKTNCLPEGFIPKFIDFVIWGHEHECEIDALQSLIGEFYISQPGSSIATSLVEGEGRKKHVGILEIYNRNFRLTKYPLQTIRPFYIREIQLNHPMYGLDPHDTNVKDDIQKLLVQKVNQVLEEAKNDIGEINEENKWKEKILVRIKVEHTGFPILINQQFGAQFVGKVANPNDILLFQRKNTEVDKQKIKASNSILENPIVPGKLTYGISQSIEALLSRQLTISTQQLTFLPEKEFAEALSEYVVKKIPSALEEFVEKTLHDTQTKLIRKKQVQNNIAQEIQEELKQTNNSLSDSQDETVPRNTVTPMKSKSIDNVSDSDREGKKNVGNHSILSSEDEDPKSKRGNHSILSSEDEEPKSKRMKSQRQTRNVRRTVKKVLSSEDDELTSKPSRPQQKRTVRRKKKDTSSEDEVMDDDLDEDYEEEEEVITKRNKQWSRTSSRAGSKRKLQTSIEAQENVTSDNPTPKKRTQSKAVPQKKINQIFQPVQRENLTQDHDTKEDGVESDTEQFTQVEKSKINQETEGEPSQSQLSQFLTSKGLVTKKRRLPLSISQASQSVGSPTANSQSLGRKRWGHSRR